MTPEQRRLFLDTLNEAPRGRTHQRPQRAAAARPLTIRVRVGDVANARASATAVAVLRGVPASGAAADIDERLGGIIGDWLQHRVVSGDAGHITPIPRSLQRQGRNLRTAYLLVGLGRFDRLSLDVIEHAAENLARFAEAPSYRSLATVAWGPPPASRPRIRSRRNCAACCARGRRGKPGSPASICTCSRAPARKRCTRDSRFREIAARRRAALAPARSQRASAGTRSRRIPGTAHLIVAAESRRARTRSGALRCSAGEVRPPSIRRARSFRPRGSNGWSANSRASR